jgi:predicted O-linked N-acetylglucosamine transferase (SPINDLY family)
MLIKTRGLMSGEACQRLHDKFIARGIDSPRIELRPPVRLIEEHLTAYGEMDIALDTFPYVGTTTTCEALWMGVPVVTLAGETHVSRVGASLLRAAGLPELIATSAEDFVRIAAELANDRERRAELRRELRSRLSASPLMDATAFTRHLEEAYRTMWRDYCQSRDL